MNYQRRNFTPSQWFGRLGVLTVGLVLAGCQSGPVETAAVRSPQSSVAQPAGSASPIENYKRKVMREAMAGLRYDTGRVEVDLEQAGALGGIGDLEAAYVEYAAGEDDLANYNNFIGAIRHFSNAVMMMPNEATFYLGLGRALAYKGRAESAESAFRTALDLDADWAEAHELLAEHLYSYGKYDEAIAEWQAALAIDGNLGAAQGRLALAYYYQNDYVRAEQHLREADRLGYEMPAQFRPLLAAELGQ